MDETFKSPNTDRPPPGKIVEVWHGGECTKGYKRDGSWHAEDGTPITIEGWRLIAAEPKPDAPLKDDDNKPKAHSRPRHR